MATKPSRIGKEVRIEPDVGAFIASIERKELRKMLNEHAASLTRASAVVVEQVPTEKLFESLVDRIAALQAKLGETTDAEERAGINKELASIEQRCSDIVSRGTGVAAL